MIETLAQISECQLRALTGSDFGIRDTVLFFFNTDFILAEDDTKLTFNLLSRRPVNDAPGHWQVFSGHLVYSNLLAFPGTTYNL